MYNELLSRLQGALLGKAHVCLSANLKFIACLSRYYLLNVIWPEIMVFIKKIILSSLIVLDL